MVRSEGNMSLKNPVTPLAIDPGTVRLEAQRLNHYASLGSPSPLKKLINILGGKMTERKILNTPRNEGGYSLNRQQSS